MSSINYYRSLLKVSVSQLLQTVGFQSAQSTALDILVEILERYIGLLSKTSHDFAELCNRSEPCSDDVARAFDKHKISIPDLEEFVKYVDTPEFELRKHLSENFLESNKSDRILPEDIRKKAKLKQKQKSYRDYLGYCDDATNKEIIERQSDEEYEFIYDYMPLMTLDKEKIQEAEKIMSETNQNSLEEMSKEAQMTEEVTHIVKNGQKFKNSTWKSVYEPKFIKNNKENESVENKMLVDSKEPVAPSAKLPPYFHKPKSKYKKHVYLNAINFCNKSIPHSQVLQTDLLEQAETKLKKPEAEPIEIETIVEISDKLDEGKVIKIAESEQNIKPLVKNVSIVDQMMESLVTKYTTPSITQNPPPQSNVKIKIKETKTVESKETIKEPLVVNETIPKLKLSLQNEVKIEKEINLVNKHDENVKNNVKVEKPEIIAESILWKPICTDENLPETEKTEKVKTETETNKDDGSHKHKKKKKNKDKSKNKDKDKEKKHKKKSDKEKGDKDETDEKKRKEEKKMRKMLKKQKKKMEKAAAALAMASSGVDTSTIGSTSMTTVDTSQLSQNTEAIPTPKKQTPLVQKPEEPKLPKLKLKLNPNDTPKPRPSISQEQIEPINFSTPQNHKNIQRPITQQRPNQQQQQQQSQKPRLNQSLPDLELGEITKKRPPQPPQPTQQQKSQPPPGPPQKQQIKTNNNQQTNPIKQKHVNPSPQQHQQQQQQSKPLQKSTPNQAPVQKKDVPKKEVQKSRPVSQQQPAPPPIPNPQQQLNQIQEQLFLQEVQNALAQEAMAREAILQEAYNNPQLLPILLPLLQNQAMMNPGFDLNSLIAQASLQSLSASQLLEVQQLTQAQMAAQFQAAQQQTPNPSKKRKTMDGGQSSEQMNRSQNKPRSSGMDQSFKRNNISHNELSQEFISLEPDESLVEQVDDYTESNEYKWHQMRVKQEEDSLREQLNALNMSRLTPGNSKKNKLDVVFTPDVNSSTPIQKKRNDTLMNHHQQPSSVNKNKSAPMKIIGQVVQETEVNSNQYWSCPACNKSDDSAPMIACDSCDDWYHWHCIGLTEEPPQNQNWYCYKCGSKPDALNSNRNEIDLIDVETHEPNDMNEITNSLMNSYSSQQIHSDYLTSLKIKKKKK
ncbi:unnamed protein product [Brachionus calyciflorus]|uniref:PHD-type domain-containing protein n=1 Tax=Brachionus calyciflorus TaxID=104777 RepID=A0A814FAJ9_9BILA|nr:unnamed protein product [Brachionus calyciflorus]